MDDFGQPASRLEVQLIGAHWSDVRIYSLTIAELWVNRIKQRHFASCFLGQMIRYIRNHGGSNVPYIYVRKFM